MQPTLILINPWIYDFAAYDLWSKPLGLLYIAGHMRELGFKVHLIDCLDVHHPSMAGASSVKKPVRRSFGTGKFWRKKVHKPPQLKHIERPYCRYGLSYEIVKEELRKIQNPVAILVTSLMTYWYPGVKEVINLVKMIHKDVPIVLGGAYAQLCNNHAVQYSGADHVSTAQDLRSVVTCLSRFGVSMPSNVKSSKVSPYPAYDLLNKIDYICLLTSTGCPFRCHYCASYFLNPLLKRRTPSEVVNEILYWCDSIGVKDFAFYDDALLVDSETHLCIILENLLTQGRNVRFHTPNALHVKEITENVSRLMHQSGFQTIRLGLESSDPDLHRNLDKKVNEGDFNRAVDNLVKSGYSSKDIGVYVLIGLPGQSVNSVIETIRFVEQAGATPFLSEYSPIPHTPLWEKATTYSDYQLSQEPLFHNNTLLPCWDERKRREIPKLKALVKDIRHKNEMTLFDT